MIYIVGAGPAGLATGLFLLEKGYKVTILEKEDKIKSTACGEACDLDSLKMLPFDSTPYFERVIEGLKFIFNGKYFYVKTRGVVLNRQKWLEGMADEFMRRGGKIKFSSKVIKVDSQYIYTEEEKKNYELCIGADGPLSVVRKFFGENCAFDVGSEYEIEYKKDDDFLEFYLSKKFSPHYAWIFPKKESINIGVIGKFSMLDRFLKEMRIDGKILAKKAGMIPYGGVEKFVKEGVVLIGDAACMANPFSLGGISPAIHAAKILAKNVVNLKRYEEEIKKHAIMDGILMKGRKAVEKLNDKEMEIIFDRIDGKEFREIKYRDIAGVLLHFASVPKFYNISRALLHSIKWGW